MSSLPTDDDEISDKHPQWNRKENTDGPMHAHWDCFSGAAGDMMLAACLDSVSCAQTRQELLQHVQFCIEEGLPELKGDFSIETKQVWRGSGLIAATHVVVQSRYNHAPAPVPTAEDKLDKEEPESTNDHSHSHDHGHSHSHGHSHGHSHAHSHNCSSTREEEGADTGHVHSHEHSSNTSGPLRNLPQIKEMLLKAPPRHISAWVRDHAIAAFSALAQAEAETHGSSMDRVHFHEVGAIDSIVDTVGTLVALDALGIETVSCSRLPLGEGTVWTDHGLLPVPAPATLRLMRGMPVCPGPKGVTGELVTPTAAALLKVLTSSTATSDSTQSHRPPCFTLRQVGVGAGTKDFHNHPNIMRLLIGDNVQSSP